MSSVTLFTPNYSSRHSKISFPLAKPYPLFTVVDTHLMPPKTLHSITSKQSLEELIPTYREIIEVKAGEENLPIMLVGNKCDEDSNREVSTEYANEMVAKILKGCGFIETSAKTGHNVHEAFQVSEHHQDTARLTGLGQ